MEAGKPITAIKGIGLTKSGKYPNELIQYEPENTDNKDIDFVDIKIIACGICGADPHFTRGDWGEPNYPIIPGHEIIGYIVWKDSNINDDEFKIGDRVGVGAQANSCNSCFRCKNGFENNCKKSELTYGNHLPNLKRQGGYASHIRVNSKFVFKIPDNLESEFAAPLMCGGMTSLAPLLETGVTNNTEVGILGIGGIGHMCIMFAKALGAKVTAISSSESKKDLSIKLGADEFLLIPRNKTDLSKYNDKFDVIIHTGAYLTNDLISNMIEMLKPNGNLQLITGPDISSGTSEILKLNVFDLISNNIKIGGICSGSISQIKFMLNLASENNIKPMIEKIKFSKENIQSAWERLDNNDVQFRFVLTDYDDYFNDL